MTFGSSAGGTTPRRRARIDAASFARTEAQPDTRPVEQERLVAEIDQPPETGRIHRAAHVLNQKIERGVGGRRQLLEGEELAQVRREGDEVAAALGGLLAQHVPEAGAHVRRNREQQGRGIAAAVSPPRGAASSSSRGARQPSFSATSSRSDQPPPR